MPRASTGNFRTEITLIKQANPFGMVRQIFQPDTRFVYQTSASRLR
jgi:hypothetical protein